MGDFIICLSCKGLVYFLIILKLFDDLFFYIDIVESDKEYWDLNSFLCFGKIFIIEDEFYKDFDEV